MTVNRQWLTDALERIIATFLQGFLVIVVAAGADQINMGTLKAAGVAGAMAVLAFLKSLLAQKVGNPESASLAPSVGPPVTP